MSGVDYFEGVHPTLSELAVVTLRERRAEAAREHQELTDYGVVYAVFDAIRSMLGVDALSQQGDDE